MTEEKENLLSDLQAKIKLRLDEKFRKGDLEHGDNLGTINSLDEAFDELIDGLTYLYFEMLQKGQKGTILDP